ncbi:hypothetical protein AWB81_01270 [Caballeronia arationis]|jgi:hypothetical protein|uniref:Uncharacterized protein n=1 Tax=Caballeronia arationis TaxID=1777142 RepID=A0A7Z7I475_9BURK|nr:hypothetical protein [Caballeronia arationis]SAK54513.1 hypothetical protein AWB81_01270 [Caballeronia arationis]SOE61170.1 hypothetical protein SAMN05446927_2059 [Caballeronia arationis]
MKALIRAAIAAAILAGPVASFAQAAAVAVSTDSAKTFDIFVDQPTGFTFVKMPGGWKFVGAVNKEEAKHLPATVLTSVLPAQASQQASATVRQ